MPAGPESEDAGLLSEASLSEAHGASSSLLPASLLTLYYGAPLWAWLQLSFAVVCVSFAGLGFVLAKDVPPFLLAGWRLLTVTVLLSPLAVREWKRSSTELRDRCRLSASHIAGAGLALAVHFGAWVSATQLTSLSHALLFVNTTPLVLAAVSLLRGDKLSRGELLGTLAAFVGVAILVSDSGSDHSVSVLGDFLAFLAAAAFALYLNVGSSVRGWCPLFIYAPAVYGIAATALLLAAVLTEGASPFVGGRLGFLGFLTVKRYAAVIFALSLGPGIGGHLSFNSVLGAGIKPLTMSMVLTIEPLLGAFVGWAAGVMAEPHARTYLGGLVLIVSTLCVVKCEAARKEREAATAAVGGEEGVELAAVGAAATEAGAAAQRPVQKEEAKRTSEEEFAEV